MTAVGHYLIGTWSSDELLCHHQGRSPGGQIGVKVRTAIAVKCHAARGSRRSNACGSPMNAAAESRSYLAGKPGVTGDINLFFPGCPGSDREASGLATRLQPVGSLGFPCWAGTSQGEVGSVMDATVFCATKLNGPCAARSMPIFWPSAGRGTMAWKLFMPRH